MAVLKEFIVKNVLHDQDNHKQHRRQKRVNVAMFFWSLFICRMFIAIVGHVGRRAYRETTPKIIVMVAVDLAIWVFRHSLM